MKYKDSYMEIAVENIICMIFDFAEFLWKKITTKIILANLPDKLHYHYLNINNYLFFQLLII
jgi:hypothetical protein